MADTLLTIQGKIAAFLDSNASAPSDGSLAWARRTSYVNRAQQMWSEAFDWQSLYKEYNAQVSAPSGNTTQSLPSDFRRLGGTPLINGLKLLDISPSERGDFGNTTRLAYVLGTPASYKLIVRWQESVDSLSSIMVPYFATPVSMTTAGAISPVPDPEYLVAKAVGMELRSLVKDHASADREDARAEMILRNMINSEVSAPMGSERTVPKILERGSVPAPAGNA